MSDSSIPRNGELEAVLATRRSAGGSSSRRKGGTFERQLVEYLKAHGFPYAERAYGAGRPDDRGDIEGVVGWVIEAKAHKTLELAKWADEAQREAKASRAKWWAVVAKRRNRPVGDSYVVLPLEMFARLLADDERTLPGSRRYGVDR